MERDQEVVGRLQQGALLGHFWSSCLMGTCPRASAGARAPQQSTGQLPYVIIAGEWTPYDRPTSGNLAGVTQTTEMGVGRADSSLVAQRSATRQPVWGQTDCLSPPR